RVPGPVGTLEGRACDEQLTREPFEPIMCLGVPRPQRGSQLLTLAGLVPLGFRPPRGELSSSMQPNTSGHRRTVSEVGRTEQLLTVAELCAALRIGRTTVYGLLRGGEIRCVRVGDRLRFRPCDVEAYLERDQSEAS